MVEHKAVNFGYVSSSLMVGARDGLEVVPAWSHKPNDVGSSPTPETYCVLAKWPKAVLS